MRMATLAEPHAASQPVVSPIVPVAESSREHIVLLTPPVEDSYASPLGVVSVNAARCILAALMLWIGALDYGFAQVPPSDIDLKAAYCIEANQAILAEQSGQEPKPLVLAQMISDTREHNNRLQGYLLPRLPELDALPLLAASKRADGDIAQLKSLAGSCQREAIAECGAGGGAQCLVERYHTCTKGELLDRLQSCTNLNWLPF